MNPNDILRACQTAMEMSPPNYLPDLPTETEPSSMPVWHSFETRAWEIGENIRAALKADRSLRRNDSVLCALADVIDCTTLRRGRQSFFFSLEYVSARKYAPRVAAYLSDKDVRGHALSALLKMRAAGYAAAVVALVGDEQAWIRRLAFKYYDRYGEAA
jgi:hypothetical protein